MTFLPRTLKIARIGAAVKNRRYVVGTYGIHGGVRIA
jgi:hypothetical protein